ncbi:E3 ubiquitin-protein ligase MIB2-like protein, partial [Leptotrombidium deliense]
MKVVGCVRYLLENNIKINKRNFYGKTELMSILQSLSSTEEEKIIDEEMLIDFPDIHFEQKYSETGLNYLHLACYGGSVKLVKKLTQKFQHVYTADNQGRYPLHIAVLYNFPEVIIALAENFGSFDINQMQCSSSRRFIELLVSMGADCNLSDENGSTSLNHAISVCHPQPRLDSVIQKCLQSTLFIREIYKTLPPNKMQSAQLAVALYLIDFGDADINIKNNVAKKQIDCFKYSEARKPFIELFGKRIDRFKKITHNIDVAK